MPPPGFGPPGLDPMLGKLVCFTVGIGGGWGGRRFQVVVVSFG